MAVRESNNGHGIIIPPLTQTTEENPQAMSATHRPKSQPIPTHVVQQCGPTCSNLFSINLGWY